MMTLWFKTITKSESWKREEHFTRRFNIFLFNLPFLVVSSKNNSKVNHIYIIFYASILTKKIELFIFLQTRILKMEGCNV